MIELAACTVTCYKALRSAAARSASMSLAGTATTCASSLVGAARTLLSTFMRAVKIRVLFSQPVLLTTTSFFHGSNACGVAADASPGGPECERDRAMTYIACRCVGTRGSF